MLMPLPKRAVICVAVFVLAGLGVALCSEAKGPTGTGGSMTTRERLAGSSWWPTKAMPSSAGYVGAEACARCHGEIAESQGGSQMAHTLMTAEGSAVLRGHMGSEYKAGPYTYTLGRGRVLGQGREGQGRQGVVMTVRGGGESRTAPLEWAFGSGEVGQSYLWREQDGSFREARFNYFATLDGFDATPGRLHGAPISIDMARGRRVEGFEARTCFGCHTTAMSTAAPLDTTSLAPGVRCEGCHGPGAEHVAAMQGRRPGAAALTAAELHVVNPSRMTPAQSVDFCGACHSTPWDARMMGAVGVQTVRFPAYRLERSRCWGASGDARLTCQACHDPHGALSREAATYDGACLQCHAKGQQVAAESSHPGKACPVATTRCVSCHMAKYELPEMHAKFTDHMIRVVRPGAELPD